MLNFDKKTMAWEFNKRICSEVIPFCARLHGLTPAEVRVIIQIAMGMKISEISRESYRSVKTLSAQKMMAYKKIGVNGDIELMYYLYWLHGNSIMTGGGRRQRRING